MMQDPIKPVRFDFNISPEMNSLDAGIEYLQNARKPVFTFGVTDGACVCKKNCGKSAGKHPIVDKWQKNLADTEEKLRDQFRKITAKTNIGLVLGEQPNGEYIVAIDVDDDERLTQLEAELGVLPQDTATCFSSRGPRFFFCISEIVPKNRLKNRTGLSTSDKAIPGIDVKVGGGQVVVAPSLHVTGAVYKWTRLGEVLTLPVAWADAILDDVAPPKFIQSYTPETLAQDSKAKKRAYAYLQRAVTEEASRLAYMPEGTRNDYLYRKAIRLLALANATYSIGKWEYVLRQLENAALFAGLTRSEVRKTLASAEKYVIDNEIVSGPRPLPIYQSADPTPSTVTPPSEPVAPAPPLEIDIDLIQYKDQNAGLAENIARLLLRHQDWAGGPRKDLLGHRVVWPSPIPLPLRDLDRRASILSDNDAAVVQAWALSRFNLKASFDAVVSGIELAAGRRAFDSLVENVKSLPPHDGIARLETWLTVYFGSPNTEVTRRVGRAWLSSALARALKPGCVADGMLILEGLEGTGKNWGIEQLFGAAWVGQLGTYKIGEHPEADRMAGMFWVLHDDELRSVRKTQKDAIFSWLTRKTDTFRLQHLREIMTVPRRAVVVGSKNPPYEYLDGGENRRFWPVRTNRIDVDAIERDREQLLAEALKITQQNDPRLWTIGKDDPIWDDLSEERSDRVLNDPMVGDVWRVLPDDAEIVTTRWVLNELGVPPERRKQQDQAVATALERLGYTSMRAPRSIPGRPRIHARSGVVLAGIMKVYL